MWERALPAKGSEAPGRMPETFLTAAQIASLESCRPAKPAFRLQGKLPQNSRFVECSGASDDPERQKLSPERVERTFP